MDDYTHVIEHLASAEIMLPSQYTDTKARRQLPPEKKLQFTVLLDGMNQYIVGKKKRQEEAEKWLKAREDGPFAFDVICACFDMDPDWVWTKLKEFKASKKPMPRRAPVIQGHKLAMMGEV